MTQENQTPLPPHLEALRSKYMQPEDSPGFLLWQVTNRWHRITREALEPLNLTYAQFILLTCTVWLTRYGECVTQVQIAQYAGVDIMMTSQVLRTLEQKNLVLRLPHPRDNRAKCVRSTAKGFETFKAGLAIIEQTNHDFFESLDQDLDSFKKALHHLMVKA